MFKRKERELALQRLSVLKDRFPEAAHILDLLESILEFQNEVLSAKDLKTDVSRLRDVDFSPFLGELHKLLKSLEDRGTDKIKEGCRRISNLSGEGVLKNLTSFLKGETLEVTERLIFIAWLQPILHSNDRADFRGNGWFKNRCPFCGFKPNVSFLKDTEEGEGVRFLRCSLCLTDWIYMRTKCVNCGNVDDDKLDYFLSQDINYIEIQTCRECNHYIKVVDLRKEGLAVPDVEDIASLSLDLWAQTQGYLKFERNLFGF